MPEFSSDTDWDFSAGSVFGYRWYTIASEPLGGRNFFLRGQRSIWYSDTFEAKCQALIRTHPAPDPSCTCGIYAYWDVHPSPLLSLSVPTVVQAEGKTILGTKGFRAERAKILGITLSNTARRQMSEWYLGNVVEQIRLNYPLVEIFSTVEDMLAKYPLTQDYKSQAPEDPPPEGFSITHFRILEGSENLDDPDLFNESHEVDPTTSSIGAEFYTSGAASWINTAKILVSGTRSAFDLVGRILSDTSCYYSIVLRIPSVANGIKQDLIFVLYKVSILSGFVGSSATSSRFEMECFFSDKDEKGAALQQRAIGRIIRRSSDGTR